MLGSAASAWPRLLMVPGRAQAELRWGPGAVCRAWARSGALLRTERGTAARSGLGGAGAARWSATLGRLVGCAAQLAPLFPAGAQLTVSIRLELKA